MRHYEIVFMVHPDQSEQVPSMLDRYADMIKQSGGSIHRKEDCGRRQLEFPIQKIYKAHYVLLNIECSNEALNELKDSFKFNDSVIRDLIIKRDEAITEPSSLFKHSKKQQEEQASR